MNAVKVNRTQLLTTLEGNRDKHKAEYEEAIAGYKQAAAQALREQADKVAEDHTVRTAVSLPKPEDHTEDYDDAIEMLSWSTEDEVEIEQHDFRNFVLDKWHWKEQFAATTQAYNSHR